MTIPTRRDAHGPAGGAARAPARPDEVDVERSGGYGRAYASVYDAVFASGGDLEAEALATLLPPRGRVVELGTGTGRVALPLALRGHHVEGVEVSAAMCEVLRAKVSDRREALTAAGGAVSVIEDDMRSCTPAGGVDLVACVLGSLACLPGADERRDVVRRAAGWLEPGGHLVVETYDRSTAVARFGGDQPVVVRTERDDPPGTLTSSYRLDAEARTWSVEHHWEGAGAPTDFRETVGFVEPEELLAWGSSAGLEPVALFGDWFGSPYTAGQAPLYVAIMRRKPWTA